MTSTPLRRRFLVQLIAVVGLVAVQLLPFGLKHMELKTRLDQPDVVVNGRSTPSFLGALIPAQSIRRPISRMNCPHFAYSSRT